MPSATTFDKSRFLESIVRLDLLADTRKDTNQLRYSPIILNISQLCDPFVFCYYLFHSVQTKFITSKIMWEW